LATRDTKDLSDDTALSQLDFATNLTYEHRTNNIKGNISSDDMVGTMDARFYQQSGYKNQPIEYGGVIELGGTFSMRDDNKSYIGAFIMNNNDGK
ncbi:MAG: hypothetical protein K0U39_01680, partial [Alphaproteobacteria bacterium]|nr:hypothetical protein [Alphaproteobacteria bacterium]